MVAILGAINSPAAGTVLLTAETAATVESDSKIFTYVTPSKITKIDPAKGQFKTRVTQHKVCAHSKSEPELGVDQV